MKGGFFGLSAPVMAGAVAGALALGAAYVLSPLAVWSALALYFLVRWAVRGLPADERRWVVAMLLVAMSIRVIAVAGLFVSTPHDAVPFDTFFGDEQFFIRRAIWLRNLALGLPVHTADLIYAFDEVGKTSYLYVLALLEVLVGPAPYGVHLVAIVIYFAASILMFRMVRPRFGAMPALAGLVLLLFLPSLFAWSISALKEPAFFLVSAMCIKGVLSVNGMRGWGRRAAGVGVVLALLWVSESVRRAGAPLIGVSIALAVALAVLVVRPRLLLAAVVVLPILGGVVLSRPSVQVASFKVVDRAAWQHVGHINTPGYVYKTLDDRFYLNPARIDDMRWFEMGQYLVRSLVAYVTVPLPWNVQSRTALVYIPEQIVWYGMVLLLPAGLLFALRRDPLLASLLFAHAAVAAFLVAITGGNVGTLVRHRGMAIPYIVWLSTVGGCHLLARLMTAAPPASMEAAQQPLPDRN